MDEVRSRLAAYREEKAQVEVAPPHVKEHQDRVVVDKRAENKPAIDDGGNTNKSSWWITILKIVLWLLVWGFFIEVEFGAVYLVVSALAFIVLSLRGGKRRAPGELSAYSVFNKNLETIEGTLSAEQFEKELRYGPSSVR